MDKRAVITDHYQGQKSAFQEVREIMLQPAPWSDDEIEDLMNQEPLNQSPQLSAEEPTEETKWQ